MTQRSWYWGGTSLGDAALPAPYGAPYTDDMFSDVFAYIFTPDRTEQGVVRSERTGLSGLLEVTNPSGTTIAVDTGIALVDGKLFTSDAAESFNTAGDGTYYAVVRKSWVAQTARLALVTSVVQTDGVTWDLPLARIIVSGGTHTITNLRKFLGFGSDLIDEKVVITGGLSEVLTFSDIPATYRNLRVLGACRGFGTATYGLFSMTVNGGGSSICQQMLFTIRGDDDTSINYSTDNSSFGLGGIPMIPDDRYGQVELFIPGYKDAIQKCISSKCSAMLTNVAPPASYLDWQMFWMEGIWRSTSPITELTFGSAVGLDAGSRLSLYGIK
jgi:hypothetical protein